ncbi:MAG: winged helix-turn-helix transcriptional regulator [Promethearchaeota archaeon]
MRVCSLGVEGKKMVEMANLVRRKKALETRWFLYEIINKNPGISVYELSKQLNWSVGKVNHHVNKLIKDGVITNSTTIENNRTKRVLKAKNWKSFIKDEDLEDLKKKISEGIK